MNPSTLSHRRAIVVGAGQSGLAVAAALCARGMLPQRDFVVIDARPPGERSWATRWPSMTLLTSAARSALPSRRLPGDQSRHPQAEEIADYLTYVEGAIGVRTIWGVAATGVEARSSGSTLHLTTTQGEVQTRNVVCATGAAAHPHIPDWATDLTVPGVLMHSSEIRSTEQVPDGDVLVVGGGSSGLHLAAELATTHSVTLSIRGATTGRAASRGRRSSNRPTHPPARQNLLAPIFGDNAEFLRNAGVTIVDDVTAAGHGHVTLADGRTLAPRSVVLATGYDAGDTWLPARARKVAAARATTAIRGLFVAGMPAYSHRKSDTLAGVWSDAKVIARQIANRP